MRKNIVEQIVKIVDDKTNKVGSTVDNLHGKVAISLPPAGTGGELAQNWFVVPVTAVTGSVTLEQAVAKYAHDRSGYQTVTAERGIARVGMVAPRTALIYLTAIETVAPFTLPITVQAPGYDISVYVNTSRHVTTRDSANASLSINTGRQFVVVLLQGGTAATSVQIPADIPTYAMEPTPEPPIWNEKPTMVYLTAAQGTTNIRLAWNNDPFAAGWNIYRAKSTQIAAIDVVADLGNGTFRVEFNTLPLTVVVDSDFYTQTFYGGRVVAVDTGLNGGIPYTHVTVEVALGAPLTPVDWEDETYVQPGLFFPLAYVADSGVDIITWEDASIKPGEVYIYKLAALGFLNETTESDYSLTEWALSNDNTPPGPITNLVVSADTTFMSAQYDTPTDSDFIGVNIYGPYISAPAFFSASDRRHFEAGTPGGPDTAYFPHGGAGIYYFATIDSIGNEQIPANAVSHTLGGAGTGTLYLPELVTVTVYPRIISGFIVGWEVTGTVNGVCQSIRATLTAGISFTNGSVELIGNLTSTKTFTYYLQQDVGQDGRIIITPYTDTAGTQNPGNAWTQPLSRYPVTRHETKRISRTEFQVTLSALPDTATIKYRAFMASVNPDSPPGNVPWNTYPPPGSTYVPIQVDEVEDTIFEYYGEIAGGYNALNVEPINRFRFDSDPRAEVRITGVEERIANQLTMMFDIDDDTASWKLFMRRGSWPTLDGTNNDLANGLVTAYVKGGIRNPLESEVLYPASTGTWYIVALGYDFNGIPGDPFEWTQVVTGTAASGPTLTMGTLTSVNITGNYYKVHIPWTHSADLETDYGGGAGPQRYKIDVYEAVGAGIYTLIHNQVHPALEHDDTAGSANSGSRRGTTWESCVKGTAGCALRTWYYKIVLIDTQTSTIINQYFVNRTVSSLYQN